MSELEGPKLVRLTTLEVRPERRRPGGRRRRREGWLVFARNAPSVDPNRGMVDIASEIPPIEATEGTEVRLTVRWIAPPPEELEPDDRRALEQLEELENERDDQRTLEELEPGPEFPSEFERRLRAGDPAAHRELAALAELFRRRSD